MSVEMEYTQWLDRLPKPDRLLLERGRAVAERLVENARDATHCWAVWSSLNERLIGGRPMADALQWHVPPGLVVVRQAVMQATVMAILRITDPPRPETDTACVLAGLLANNRVIELISSKVHIGRGDAGSDRLIVDFERLNQPSRIKEFKSLVPLGYHRGDRLPDDDRLVKLRTALKGCRDRHIAHSDNRETYMPTVDEVEMALKLSVRVAELASLIFRGHNSGLHLDPKDDYKADDVWYYLESGLVAAHQAWKSEADKLRAQR